MKIRIDTDACTGHGRCYSLAPELFEPDDEGFGVVTKGEVGSAAAAAARSAASSCPERAVLLEG